MLRQATTIRTTRHWRPAFASPSFCGTLHRSASSGRGRDAALGTDKARVGDGGYGDGVYLTSQQDSRRSSNSRKNTHNEDELLQADSDRQGARANNDVALTGIDDDELLGVDFAESEAPEGLP